MRRDVAVGPTPTPLAAPDHHCAVELRASDSNTAPVIVTRHTEECELCPGERLVLYTTGRTRILMSSDRDGQSVQITIT